MDLKEFLRKFDFDRSKRGAVGVEREYFLVDENGRPAPDSRAFLAMVNDPVWTYELSACQVEHRTAPHKDLGDLRFDLWSGQYQGQDAAERIGRKLAAMEVGPADMPLDHYPDDPRYGKIVKNISRETLLAGCRVTGVHLHFGVTDISEAIEWHNLFARNLDELCRMGDHSGGERLRIYKVMAAHWKPTVFDSPEHFHEVAREQGFEDNPRDCWSLVRISRHGTVELRMFGMTDDPEEIVGWVVRASEMLG